MKMKMKLVAFLAFALLSISILSYGVTGSVFADSHNVVPFAASSNMDIIANGGNVIISGDINYYDSALHSGQDITVIIKSPSNNLVTIKQITPSSDGSFQFNFVAGGPLWKVSGDYIVELRFGADKTDVTINYVGGTFVGSAPEPVDKEPEPVDKEPEPVDKEPEPVDKEPTCGAGTELVNGICQVTKIDESNEKGGGCLIATAAYGSELAPQVQFLREIRDNQLMSTESGAAFMESFNDVYYSFSPYIADMERENPAFQEAVRVFITPMMSTLSIMTLAETGNDAQVLGLGISVIALNLGLYIAAPAAVGFTISRKIKSRK